MLKNAKRFLGIGLLSALSLLPLKNADAADWWWGKVGDTGMEVRVNDTYYGNAERIEFGHKVENVNSWPTVAVFYSDGAIRLKEPQDPDNFFGTSFYPGPAYWSNNNYYSNPTIEKIEVSGDFEQGPFDIKLTGRNNDFDVVYDLKMYSPKQNNNKMVLRVKQSYNCNNDVTIDSNRQDLHEGFKIAKLTSMYINNNYHDSDSARYINDLEELVNSNFNDFLINGFIFTDPNKMGKPWIEATHSDDGGWQFNTPNVRIQVEGSLANYTPQGFFTQTIDYNDDNISLWINNDDASAFFVNDTNTTAYWIVSQDNPYSASAAPTIEDFKQHSGVNLPWGRGTYGGTYGHSVGDNPYGEHDGFSSSIGRKNLIEDFYFMKSKGVKLSRVFIFCDARSGFEYENENVTSLDSYVGEDMQTLLDIANAHNIKIMPVLFDYMLADGVQLEWGSRVGEHPEFITDTEKKYQLFENALRPFIRGFGNHNAVYAWEIINEPEYASAVSQDPLRNFFVELTDLIKEEVPNAIVTVGSDKRSDVDLWANPIMSLDQFHHYDYMGSLDYLASKVSYNPILIGEVQPVNVIDKLETISRNNYKGALFWSLNADYDFKAVADEFKNWMTSDDLDAPIKVSGLTAEDTLNDNGGSISLSWNANSEQDVDHYNVYRSIGTIEDVIGMTRIESVNTNSFTDSSTVDGTDYYYAVTAVDNSGNEYFIVDDFGPAKSIDNITDSGEGNGGSGGGGCFIATAAYGTIQAQEVNILSKFRDGYLIKNPLGKVFVNQYYRLSPAIAEKIKDAEVLKKMIRIGLKPVISVLKKLEI